MDARVRPFLRSVRASAAVEFALVVPFMVAVALGSFEVFMLGRAALRVNFAAETMANITAQETDMSSADSTRICAGAKLTMLPLTTTGFSASIASVTYPSGSGSRAQDWEDHTCGSGTAMTNAVSLAVTDTPNRGDSAIVVTVTYTYQSPVRYFLSANRTVTATFIAKPRGGSKITKSS